MKNTNDTKDLPAIDSFRIRIVLASETDLPSITSMEEESHVEPWSERSFLEELHRPVSHLWVAHLWASADHVKTDRVQDEKSSASSDIAPDFIAGYLCCWLVADELQILNVTVDRRWRRRGIGMRLLSHAIDWGRAHKARTAVLEVRKSNLAAQLLYRDMGFYTVGERPDYYGVAKEAAVLMERVIANE